MAMVFYYLSTFESGFVLRTEEDYPISLFCSKAKKALNFLVLRKCRLNS